MVGGLGTKVGLFDKIPDRAVRQAAAKNAGEKQKLQEEVEQLRAEKEALRLKVTGLSSRNKTLEGAQVTIREKIGLLLKKTETDDQLVAAQRSQIAALRAKLTASGVSSADVPDDAELSDVDHLRNKCREYEQQVGRQEHIILALQTQLAEFK